MRRESAKMKSLRRKIADLEDWRLKKDALLDMRVVEDRLKELNKELRETLEAEDVGVRMAKRIRNKEEA